MEGVEHEICNNCKKVIPQHNYVMHTMHCARNIALCKVCKEPIPKLQIVDHENKCKPKVSKPAPPPPSLLEKSSYFQTRKAIEDKKAEDRKERYMQRMDRLVDSGYSLKDTSSNSAQYTSNSVQYTSNSAQYTPKVMDRSSGSRFSGYATPVQQNGINSSFKPEIPSERPLQHTTNFSRTESTLIRSNTTPSVPAPTGAMKKPEPVKSSGMLECKYCDLELPKLDLEEHETYCGTRTDKCLECGDLVMFRDKQSHMDSNHPQLKRRGRNPPPAWDSAIPRSEGSALDPPQRQRPQPLATFDYDPMPYLPSNYQAPSGTKKKEGENYKEISRRLDCLSSTPSFTVPVYTPSPAYRRRNPPTELVIPCEFCGVPVPHEDLIEHETGCRPDLARFNPRRRVLSPEPDDYNDSPPQPSSPEVELPCEFCGDMIPASQLLGHQIRCN